MPNLARSTLSSSMTAAYTWRWPRWRHMVAAQVLVRGQGEADLVNRIPGRGLREARDHATRPAAGSRPGAPSRQRTGRIGTAGGCSGTPSLPAGPSAIRLPISVVPSRRSRRSHAALTDPKAMGDAARDRWLPGFLRDGSLCGLAYRRLSFGPVGCTLGRTDKR
jgi:hypothetical protein